MLDRYLRFGAKALLSILLTIGLIGGLSLLDQYVRSERGMLQAATLTIPYTFSSGGVIYASQMNSNFTAIRDVVNAIDDANITNASITGSTKLVNASVTLGKMASDSVDSSKIVNGSIALADMGSASVGSSQLVADSVTPAAYNDASCQQLFMWRAFDLADATVTNYFGLDGDTGAVLNESTFPATRIPVATYFHTLRVTVTVAPGSGKSWLFRLKDDAVDTALQCTISDAATSCTDLGSSVLGATDSRMYFRATPTSTPALPTRVWVSLCGSID